MELKLGFIRQRRSPSPQSNPGGFDSIYGSLLGFLERLGTKRRRWAIISLVIAVALITLASLPVLKDLMIISVLLAFPAGLILFANIVGLIHFTKISETRLASYKERIPQSRRIRTVAVTAIVLAAVLIFSGSALDGVRGLGGASMIALALGAVNLLRRTPEEAQRAKLGLPDPREISMEEE